MKSVLSVCCWSVKLKKSELYCSLCKGCVVVEHMVSAVIVVMVSSVACSVCSVPNVCEISHCLRFFPVDFFKEVRVYRSAVAVHSASVEVQSICNQAFVTCHNVCKVSHCLWCVSLCSNVNVNSAPSCGITFRPCFAKSSDKFLQGFHVLVFKDWRYQFAFMGIVSRNADVLLKFPFSFLTVPSRPCIVTVY